MEIKQAVTQKEKEELDRLLWEILWEPLDFPRDIHESFKLDSPQTDLIAVDKGKIIGVLVANRLSGTEIELRHIAIESEYQGNGVGRMLVEKLLGMVKQKAPLTISTHARNTSVGFFEKFGFIPDGDYLEPEDFARHGIKIQPMLLPFL